jgi:hypothetical protein
MLSTISLFLLTLTSNFAIIFITFLLNMLACVEAEPCAAGTGWRSRCGWPLLWTTYTAGISSMETSLVWRLESF